MTGIVVRRRTPALRRRGIASRPRAIVEAAARPDVSNVDARCDAEPVSARAGSAAVPQVDPVGKRAASGKAPRRRSPAARWLAFAAAAAFALAAHDAIADVYGYVDDAGQVHLATERLDDRYQLFLKARDGGPPKADVPQASAAPDAALAKTRLFQRLVDHPNIARYAPLIDAAAARHGLDPHLVKAVIAVESGFEPTAVSDKGAVGLMQVLPATGERYGVRADKRRTVDAKLADPALNLEIGTRYLADLRSLFVGRPDLALAAYNAGENAVARFRNTIPPFAETQAYVKLVDQFYAYYAPPKAAPRGDDRVRVTLPAARRNLPDPALAARFADPSPAPRVETDPIRPDSPDR